MDPPLRVLHLEDAIRDTELVQASLEEEGIRSELKERAEQIGATLAVTSEPHAGTMITAVSPYQEPVAT
jgi:signal transduction histidine kinase